MSRVGKAPIPVSGTTKVEIKGQQVTVTGAKGTLSRVIHADIRASMQDDMVVVTRPSDQKRHRALHGLTRALINNMVVGVSEGFKKDLEVRGVGYRMELEGRILTLHLGFSHPIVIVPPDGISFSISPKENRITIEGIDKELVGEVAAKVRALRKPEPYKGKGIRYLGEQVRTKAGKSAGA